MPDPNLSRGAHLTFPLSAPALQGASITPDYNYLDIKHAHLLNSRLSLPGPSFSPGEIAAVGLMGKAALSIIHRHLGLTPGILANLDAFLQARLGLENAQSSLPEVLDRFPTSLSYADSGKKHFYGFGSQGLIASRHSYYYSLILILLAENNPAIMTRDGVFTDPILRGSFLFQDLLAAVQDFFSLQTDPGVGGMTLVDFLLEPSRQYPLSIFDQLLFIKSHWSHLLDSDLLRSLLISLDQIKEEAIRLGPGSRLPEDPLGYLSSGELGESEPINFSPDQDWMPRVILQAKNVFVWLHQLSKEYNRSITRLDQIPDEELGKLASRGINALWLIGLWDRSPASQKIKQICGNPEAVSSAYSIYDYSIAESLGGDDAYQYLSSRASNFHIRLAADMVPNHMGIDSAWVTQYPDRFLSLDHPPFPGYTFNGVDLSSDPSISIHLEDHYYDKTDAAVVFRRSDNRTGETRYIYHGNDGTSMPWNDTAQLDFLNPEVREAVIQTVLEVARKFPIIRFDAAMTLSKKHYQRLWFPQPGTGGAIPTRSNFSLTRTQFDAHMPKEFWRELVDRVAEEVPDTLLLAEAFWMMEGYFVRTLGMHRVYNSAFMHMLRDEDNKKYRDLIISTLEYDPQILKRYVNFMNNPDEETALSQFGSGGKYFGTCLLMSTLPGLPMFGHGQIEGFSEKYGMEYQKAYYDESPDPAFIKRHQKEIFPLLHKRYLFSEVDHFYLYDLVMHDGTINQDVFIYSNRQGDERALIVFYNKWGDTKGRIINTTPLNGSSIDLLSGLGISSDAGDFLIFHDQASGLDYIRRIRDLEANGLYLDLGAYDYHSFINFRTATDHDGSYSALEKDLNGAGVYNLPHRRLEIKFLPLIEPIAEFLTGWETRILPALFREIGSGKSASAVHDQIRDITARSGDKFFNSLSLLFPAIKTDKDSFLDSFQRKNSGIAALITGPHSKALAPDPFLLLPWAFLADHSLLFDFEILEAILSSLINTHSSYENIDDAGRVFLLRRLSLAINLTSHLKDASSDLSEIPGIWQSDPLTHRFINLHEFEGHSWFHKESMEALIDITFNIVYISLAGNLPPGTTLTTDKARDLLSFYDKVIHALEKSNFRWDKFTQFLSLKPDSF